jgi:hypothetical protein
MKKFMAVYMGSAAGREQAAALRNDPARMKAGMEAWMKWGEKHRQAIAYQGAPLGKTKRVSKQGIADTQNLMTGFTVVEAESFEAAAQMFLNHPHFAVFPGDSVEIMECLPIPTL